MVDYGKLEKFSKSMEKWHNKIFPLVSYFLMFSSLIISAVAVGAYYELEDNLKQTWNENDDVIIPYEVFQIFFYIGTFGIPLYIAYTKIFTKFRFPIDFKGNGRGIVSKPSYVN